MDMMTIAAFLAFFALVLAWLVAPAAARRPVIAVDPSPSPTGAD